MQFVPVAIPATTPGADRQGAEVLGKRMRSESSYEEALDAFEKRMRADELREQIESSIESSYSDFAPLGRDAAICKRQRCGKYFTTDDLESTKALVAKREDETRKKEFYECWNEALEEERWACLQYAWEKHKRMAQEPAQEKPGIFHVSQTLNTGYDTYKDFVCTSRDRGHACMTHPDGGNACTYKKSDLVRNEEWLREGNLGRAPDWYLGSGDSWVHGAFVHVQRISDYVPPANSKPVYGIITSSFRAG